MAVKLNVFAVWTKDPNTGKIVPVGITLDQAVADQMIDEMVQDFGGIEVALNLRSSPAVLLFDDSEFDG